MAETSPPRGRGEQVNVRGRPRAAMQSLVDALRDFEAGFRLDREQPRADQARPAIAARRPA